jgi:hypothetical protein
MTLWLLTFGRQKPLSSVFRGYQKTPAIAGLSGVEAQVGETGAGKVFDVGCRIDLTADSESKQALADVEQEGAQRMREAPKIEQWQSRLAVRDTVKRFSVGALPKFSRSLLIIAHYAYLLTCIGH